MRPDWRNPPDTWYEGFNIFANIVFSETSCEGFCNLLRILTGIEQNYLKLNGRVFGDTI